MDIIEFYTENLEFKVRFKKELRKYSLSNFGKYKITIEFINSIEQPVLQINTTEKEFVSALESLNNFSTNFGNITDDIIYFENNGDFSRHFLYISVKNILPDCPLEEDDISVLSFYLSNPLGDNILKLYFECSLIYLEDFIFKMYTLVEDIPYLEDIFRSSFLEYMQFDPFRGY